METYLYTQNNNTDGYKLWMAYPACESFALASLGYLWLSKIADENPQIYTEKVFTDSDSTKFNPKEIGAIAFSISFDFDFMTVLGFDFALRICFFYKFGSHLSSASV